MFANLKLGFRDIWEHKFFVFACIAFIVIFNLIQVMTALTLYHHQKLKEDLLPEVTSFDIIYTQYDYTYHKEALVDIVSIYEEGAVSIKRSTSLSESYARPVFFVFGDASLINPNISNQDGTSVYAYDTSLDNLQVYGVDYPIRNIPLTDTYTDRFADTYILDSNALFVVYQGNAIAEVIDYLSMEGNPNIFWDFISNTHIIFSDVTRINGFKNFISDRVDGISIKSSFFDWSNTRDHMHKFLVDFLLPLSVVLLLIGILSFLTIFRGILQRMKCDLTIHLQSGARFRDVLARFYVFYGAIIAVSFAILFLQGAIFSLTAPFVYTFFIIITVSVCLYIARALKRTNLFDNLRGDYV